MKNLLLLLILANVLYFMWGMFGDDKPQPGVAVVNEPDLGPALAVTTRRVDDTAGSVGAVLGSGEPSDLAAVVGRSCVSVGPFRDTADADEALTQYRSEGMRVALRTAQGQVFVGHSVFPGGRQQYRKTPQRGRSGRRVHRWQRGGWLRDFARHLRQRGKRREGRVAGRVHRLRGGYLAHDAQRAGVLCRYRSAAGQRCRRNSREARRGEGTVT